jgi:hypothetical protein
MKTPTAAIATITVTAQSILPLDVPIGRLVHREGANRKKEAVHEDGLVVITLGAKFGAKCRATF